MSEALARLDMGIWAYLGVHLAGWFGSKADKMFPCRQVFSLSPPLAGGGFGIA